MLEENQQLHFDGLQITEDQAIDQGNLSFKLGNNHLAKTGIGYGNVSSLHEILKVFALGKMISVKLLLATRS